MEKAGKLIKTTGEKTTDLFEMLEERRALWKPLTAGKTDKGVLDKINLNYRWRKNVEAEALQHWAPHELSLIHI